FFLFFTERIRNLRFKPRSFLTHTIYTPFLEHPAGRISARIISVYKHRNGCSIPPEDLNH
ncbi:MAG: hypothetical protein WDA41_09490, partial [Candidatus Neomarinimicrobiota bacterium]